MSTPTTDSLTAITGTMAVQSFLFDSPSLLDFTKPEKSVVIEVPPLVMEVASVYTDTWLDVAATAGSAYVGWKAAGIPGAIVAVASMGGTKRLLEPVTEKELKRRATRRGTHGRGVAYKYEKRAEMRDNRYTNVRFQAIKLATDQGTTKSVEKDIRRQLFEFLEREGLKTDFRWERPWVPTEKELDEATHVSSRKLSDDETYLIVDRAWEDALSSPELREHISTFERSWITRQRLQYFHTTGIAGFLQEWKWQVEFSLRLRLGLDLPLISE